MVLVSESENIGSNVDFLLHVCLLLILNVKLILSLKKSGHSVCPCGILETEIYFCLKITDSDFDYILVLILFHISLMFLKLSKYLLLNTP